MDKPKRKINRNRIIGISTFILSVVLLITFISLVSSDITLTDNVYEAEIFTFIFGSLGLVTSIGLFFTKT